MSYTEYISNCRSMSKHLKNSLSLFHELSGSYEGVAKDSGLLGCDTVSFGQWFSDFRTHLGSLLLKVKQTKKNCYCSWTA
jgi:hypothetical protein